MGTVRLKRYELVRPLASGGMAEVHLARTSGAFGIEKLLVVKKLLPELAANPQFARMFVDEARLAVTLNHANIVQVYDVDEVDGIAFYAMEYLHGQDLRCIARRLRQHGRRMPLEHAISIVLSMCAALHYAHEMVDPSGNPLGIVHRDVSPHNVFVRYDGVVKVIDFGIAKAKTSFDRTATGVLKGKFGYMSPEQCLHQPLDRRSDVFCIAVVLYELTTGRRLFKGPTEYDILKKIIETEPEPPSMQTPDYPAQLERVVMRGLKRDRAARYSTALDLALDLEALARELGLEVAQTRLARFMSDLFADEVAEWRAAEQSHVTAMPRGGRPREEDENWLYAEGTKTIAEPRTETKTVTVTETNPSSADENPPVRSPRRKAATIVAAFAFAAVAVAAVSLREPVAPSAAGPGPALGAVPPAVVEVAQPAAPDPDRVAAPPPPPTAAAIAIASAPPQAAVPAKTAAPRKGRSARPRPAPPVERKPPAATPDPDAPLPH